MKADFVVKLVINKKSNVVQGITLTLNGNSAGDRVVEKLFEKFRIFFLAIFSADIFGIVRQGILVLAYDLMY